MSNIGYMISAKGNLDSKELGKIYYDFTIHHKSDVNQDTAKLLKDDLEDFERYLQEKYVVLKVKEIDKFPIWRKLKNAIKKIF